MNFIDFPDATTLHTIETCSGVYVDVSDPNPDTIRVDDIAWALSRQARFAGHTLSSEIWSVGQHSLFVEHLLDLVLSNECGPELGLSLRDWLAQAGVLDEYVKQQFSIPRVLFGALIHDTPEAYLVDLPTPVKRSPLILTGYRELEARMESAIGVAFKFPKPSALEHEMIKWSDMLALRIEAAHLLPSRGLRWGITSPSMSHQELHLFPEVLGWSVVCAAFIKRFNELELLRWKETR